MPVNRIRRGLLKVLFALPASLTLAKVFTLGEFIVIDGWVLNRSDLESDDRLKDTTSVLL